MLAPLPIAEAAQLLPDKAGLLAFYSAVGGACGLARAANAAGAVAPSLWSIVSMMIVGAALGCIAGGVCMARFGVDDVAFYWTTAISGLFGFIGPTALELLRNLTKGTGSKGTLP
jgi:hypothetical protein